MHTIYRPWFQTDFSASWVSLLVHCPVSDSLNSQSLPLSTLCLASAGNSSLVLFFHPVLEYPVTMEHDALVAEEENFGWKINSPTRQPAIFVFPLCVSYAWPTASNSDAPLKIYKLSKPKPIWWEKQPNGGHLVAPDASCTAGPEEETRACKKWASQN